MLDMPAFCLHEVGAGTAAVQKADHRRGAFPQGCRRHRLLYHLWLLQREEVQRLARDVRTNTSRISGDGLATTAGRASPQDPGAFAAIVLIKDGPAAGELKWRSEGSPVAIERDIAEDTSADLRALGVVPVPHLSSLGAAWRTES